MSEESTVKDQVVGLAAHAETRPLLFAGPPKIDGHDPYTIHDVGSREGQRLRTGGEVRHCGWGLFMAFVAGGSGKSEISFDGGGAMQNIRGTDADHPGFYLSWSPLRADKAQLDNMGYDPAVQAAYLTALAATL